jgi:predicted acetyltransferase
MSAERQYRFADADEIEEVGRMIAHSFPGAERPADWWSDQLQRPVWGGGADTLFIGSDAGRIVAALQLHPLRQWVSGAALTCAGVGTVAIAPTHRRRGLGAALMSAALHAAHERGDAVSALYPFRMPFYGRLGYGQSGEALQYQVPPATLPDSPERRRVELLDTPGAQAEALELYGRWARTQCCQLERGGLLWAQLTGGHDRALVGYRSSAGTLDGYALVRYRADMPSKERYLEVDEIVWTSADARRGLYGWIASLGDQWRSVLLRALPGHRLGDWLTEPRLPRGTAPPWGLWAPAATLLMGPMVRLIDVRAAWEARRVEAGPALALSVELGDTQLPHNAGSWHLAFEAGRVAVERRAAPAGLALRTDVATLSRLFTGALAPSAALQCGLLECDAPALLPSLDALLALPEPWTFDRF